MRIHHDAPQQTVDDERDPRVNSAVDEPTDYRPELPSDQNRSDVDRADGSGPATVRQPERPEIEADTEVGAEADTHTEPDMHTGPDMSTEPDAPADRPTPADPAMVGIEPTPTPGEPVPDEMPAEHPVGLWRDETLQGFRDRLRDVQLRFVDDPRSAAGEAQTLLAEVVDALSAEVARHQRDLDAWSSADGGDTEQLRMVVRRYREFLDRVLGM